MDSTPLQLGVNIDHSATVRQARYRGYDTDVYTRMIEPDPVEIALLAERGGADAITLHLREDRRHIQDQDVFRMRASILTKMNLEMAATEEMQAIALKVKPETVLLVPESREEVTTEGGLNVVAHYDRISALAQEMRVAGIAVSLFIDPMLDQIQAAAQLGVEAVELHTGAYAHAFCEDDAARKQQMEKLQEGAAAAHQAADVVLRKPLQQIWKFWAG